MIPNNGSINDFNIEEETSKTYILDGEKRIVYGNCDGIEAVKQAIHLTLNIERYEHIIYSWDYGIETLDLIGREISYVLPELKRRVTEALTQDSRILSVDAFNIVAKKGKVQVTFVVKTIYGNIDAMKEVSI